MSVFLNDYREIERILKKNGSKKPFLCCGKSFQQTDVFKYLKQFDITVFDNIRPNPRFDDMITAAELFRERGCDFMLAAGGGSPMDSAKMIRLMATNGSENALTQPMKNNDIKALFIPTTSGTGSEATKTSVFYINENEKFSVHNYDFIPDYILFDERLLKTVPMYQRKATCLDALCHSIESYWSTKANRESREYAEKAIKLFFEYKDRYIANTDEGNRGMLEASFYGGKAINVTGTVAPHALCYSITMNCGTAHGHSVAVLLATIYGYMLEKSGASDVLDGLGRVLGGTDAESGLAVFKALLDEFALEQPRIESARLDEFVSKVNVSKLSTNPVPLDSRDIKEINKRTLCD